MTLKSKDRKPKSAKSNSPRRTKKESATRKRICRRLPKPTPNFDAEMQAVAKKLSRSTITKINADEFADYYLTNEGKSIDEFEEDLERFYAHEQYDEDGLMSLRMSAARTRKSFSNSTAKSRRSICRRTRNRSLKCCSSSSSAYEIGGRAAQAARHFVACRKIENADNIRAREAFR